MSGGSAVPPTQIAGGRCLGTARRQSGDVADQVALQRGRKRGHSSCSPAVRRWSATASPRRGRCRHPDGVGRWCSKGKKAAYGVTTTSGQRGLKAEATLPSAPSSWWSDEFSQPTRQRRAINAIGIPAVCHCREGVGRWVATTFYMNAFPPMYFGVGWPRPLPTGDRDPGFGRHGWR